MSVSKLKTERMLLAVVDDGQASGPIPLRRLLLAERDGGAVSLVMYALNVPRGAADAVAAWFASLGVEVEGYEPSEAADSVPPAFFGQAEAAPAAGDLPGAVARGGDAGPAAELRPGDG